MKKLLLILLVLPMIGFGQSWRYSSQGNDFDGKYKISSIVGTGNDYPYNSPKLVICYTEKSNEIDFYISDAGYYTSSSNTQVMLSFNNEKGIIYKSLSLGYSSDRKSVFLDGNFSPNYLSPIKIFQKLMEASYVNIRIKNDYGQNDIRFSLNGSTKAIKYVIPYDAMLARELEREKVVKENQLVTERAKEAILHIRDSAIIENLKHYNISIEISDTLKGHIIQNIEYHNYWDNRSIDSIVLYKEHLYGNLIFSYDIFYIEDEFLFSKTFKSRIVVPENYVDSIPFAAGLIEADEIKEIVKEGLNEKPKRKDYKSSSDYMKALRKYHKSIE